MDSDTEEDYVEQNDTRLKEQDWDKLRQNRIKDGFREGFSAGQEAALQDGFNNGYTHSVKMAFRMAQMRGHLCSYLSQQLDQSNETEHPLSNVVQDLVEKLSALEEKLAKARNDESFTKVRTELEVKTEHTEDDKRKMEVFRKNCTCEDLSKEGGFTPEKSLKNENKLDTYCGGVCHCKSKESDSVDCGKFTSVGLEKVKDQLILLEASYTQLMQDMELNTVI